MKFLDRLNFSKKLYVLLTIPVIALIFYASIPFTTQIQNVSRYDDISKLTKLSAMLSDFIHETQKERGLNAGYLSNDTGEFDANLDIQHDATDVQQKLLFTYIKESDVKGYAPNISQDLSKVVNKLHALPRIRTQVANHSIKIKDMLDFYTDINTRLLKTVALLSKISSNASINQQATIYMNFLQAKEQIGLSRAVGTNALLKGKFSDNMKIYFTKLIAQENAYMKNFSYLADDQTRLNVESLLQEPEIAEVSNLQERLLTAVSLPSSGIDAATWFDKLTYKINKFKEIEEVLSKQLLDTASNLNQNALYTMIGYAIFNTLIFVMIGILTYLMTNRISNQVTKLQKGLGCFLDYIAHEKDALKALPVEGNDEFSKMTVTMNEHIEKITSIVEQDRKVVNEIEDVVHKVSNGFFGTTVKEHGASKEVEQLRNSLNEMITSTKEKFSHLIDLLNHFSQGKFDYELPHDKVKGLNGDFGAVITSAKLLGDNVSELFALIQNAGAQLNDNTKVLSGSSNTLENSSHLQLEFLSATTTVLENMKVTTKETMNHVKQTTDMADKLAKTSEKGLVMASKTAAATDDISEKVEAISEAISIIDQIAFQTNILSLNAAVEAATAGDAGKGFSVVAQEVRNLATKSAEAANEIKVLVEIAKTKANEGKTISNEMISDYHQLKDEITITKDSIQAVDKISRIQEKDTQSINGSIDKLNDIIKDNDHAVADMSHISSEVTALSDKLFHIVSMASFKEEIRNQVCDMELNDTISQMKNKHLMFKSNILSKLDLTKRFDVTPPTHCDLGRWMHEQVTQKRDFTLSPAWSVLVNDHNKIHALAQEYVDKNASGVESNILNSVATQLEGATINIFKSLDGIKHAHCSQLKEKSVSKLVKKERVIA